jgi:Flp pilus assembly pilin Flp
MTHPARFPRECSPRGQRGSATAEYAIVALFVVVVLVANENVIKELADAIRNAYAAFGYALSVSWL